jgi:ABC-type multidrug transport system fused ATPase/permease subunit
MDQGRVREVGSHQELLASSGLYRRLHDLQFRDTVPDLSVLASIE